MRRVTSCPTTVMRVLSRSEEPVQQTNMDISTGHMILVSYSVLMLVS
jgi:hypothetical protein